MADLGAGRGEKEGVGGEEEIGGKSQELEVGGENGLGRKSQGSRGKRKEERPIRPPKTF